MSLIEISLIACIATVSIAWIRKHDPKSMGCLLAYGICWGAWIGYERLLMLTGVESNFINYYIPLWVYCFCFMHMVYFEQYCPRLSGFLALNQCGLGLAAFIHLFYVETGVQFLKPVYAYWEEVGYLFLILNAMAFIWRWWNVDRVNRRSGIDSEDRWLLDRSDRSVLAYKQATEGTRGC